MSTLAAQLEVDLLAAMKERDDFARDTLRYLKSALKNAEIAQNSGELTDEQVVALIQKEVKKRHEACSAFTRAGKPELAEQETKEAALLQAYLPAQKSEAEIQAAVTEYLANNPTTAAEFGRAMSALGGQLKGQADLGLVSRLLKAAIGS